MRLLVAALCCAMSALGAQDTRARIGLPGYRDAFPIEDVTTPFDLNATKAKSHEAIKAAFADMTLALDRDEPSGAVIGIQNAKASHNFAGYRMSRLFDCGSNSMGLNADSYRITIVFLALLDATDSTHTKVRIGVVGGGEPAGGGRALAVQCSSSGVLEARLMELAGKHLQ
jgi:hypothetical protein